MQAIERDSAAIKCAAEGLAPWRAELAATFALAWPLVIAQLAHIALSTTDVIMMGWLGPRHLAAGTLSTALYHPFLMLGMGVVSAVATLVAQALGARDFRSVRRSTRQGFWVALLFSAAIVPLLLQTETILSLLGQEAETALLAGGYMLWASWALLPSLLFIVLRSFLSAHGLTRIILTVTLLGIVVNAAGNYALMFGNWGFPRMELAGAGLSTTLTSTIGFFMVLAYALTHRRMRRYHVLARFWRPDWPRFRRIIVLGVPIGLMFMAETGMFAAAAMLMGWLGTAELAAHAVALQCAALAFMVPLGLSLATTVRVGLASGRQDREAVGRAGWTSLALGLVFMGTTALLFLTAPGLLVGVFLDPGDPRNMTAFTLAVSYLAVAALFQLVDGAQVVSAAALRGLGDTALPMVLAVTGYWAVGLPIAWLSGFRLDMGGVGVWYGLASGLAFVAIVLTTRFALRERLRLV